MDAIYEDIGTDAVKIGMLPTPEVMSAVAEKLRKYCPKNVVVDPVMYAKDGTALMAPQSIETFKAENFAARRRADTEYSRGGGNHRDAH